MDKQDVWQQGNLGAVLPAARETAALLRDVSKTVAVAESSAGGLISAALLAIPGASDYFRGGAVVYTGDTKAIMLGENPARLSKPRAATTGHAIVLAEAVRQQLGASWGIGETGAAGPTGNRYGDDPGHSCVAIVGPEGQEATETVTTGASDRVGNMAAFAVAALRLLAQTIRRG